MHGEWLRYAKSTSQDSLAFSLKVSGDWGSQVNPLMSSRHIGKYRNAFFLPIGYLFLNYVFEFALYLFICILATELIFFFFTIEIHGLGVVLARNGEKKNIIIIIIIIL